MTPRVNTNVFNFAGLLSILSCTGSLLFEFAVTSFLFEITVAVSVQINISDASCSATNMFIYAQSEGWSHARS